MKLTKKKVFVAALAVCLVAILSLGTLAWFTDSESVENKFYFATSEDNEPDEVFSIELSETEAGPYEDVLPGDVLDKNPTVKNTGYYDQYVRVTITITKAAQFRDYIAGGNTTLRSAVFAGYDSTNWESDNFAGELDTDTNTLTYTLYYNGILEEGQTIVVFTDLIIPEGLVQSEAATFNSGAANESSFDITVKADAVQTENVGAVDTNTDAANAKIAFTTVSF